MISAHNYRLQFITERSHGSGNSSSLSRAEKVDAFFYLDSACLLFSSPGFKPRAQCSLLQAKSSISINVLKILSHRQAHESQLIQAVPHEGLISEVSLHCVKLTIKANHHTTREQGNPFTNSKMLQTQLITPSDQTVQPSHYQLIWSKAQFLGPHFTRHSVWDKEGQQSFPESVHKHYYV